VLFATAKSAAIMSTSTMWPRLPAGFCITGRKRLNVATGTVATFRAGAEQVVALAPRPPWRSRARRAPPPCRTTAIARSDAAGTAAAFPDFRYTALAEGLAQAQRQECR